jgi:hypothetical protein
MPVGGMMGRDAQMDGRSFWHRRCCSANGFDERVVNAQAISIETNLPVVGPHVTQNTLLHMFDLGSTA